MSYIIADNIITSLGFATDEVVNNIEKGITGVVSRQFESLTKAPVSLIDRTRLVESFSEKENKKYTLFEKCVITSIKAALANSQVSLESADTLLILSTTKGNIELLKGITAPKDGLVASAAKHIADYFSAANKPIVVCNACISGVLAINLGHRYLSTGKYKNIVIAGADMACEFIVAGFESFKSMSEVPCKPFDANRTGLSLGEGAGTIILSSNKPKSEVLYAVKSGSSANDANHISGPSRTGEGAYLAGKRALGTITNIDYISAHGTATPFNDDMESIAIQRLGFSDVPVNSFKGYFGHTLGAAGVIESILAIQSMKQNKIFKTLGLEQPGVKEKINLIQDHQSVNLNMVLKMASGFGGSNASVVFEKQ